LAAGAVEAADIPVKVMAQPAPPPPSWSRCYIGINGGWIHGRDRVGLSPSGNYLTPAAVPSPPNAAGSGLLAGDIVLASHDYRTNDNGGTVGFTSGCNWQTQNFVFGYEGDTNWSSLRTNVSAAYPTFTSATPAFTGSAHTEQVSTRLDFFSTYRLRAGYLVTDTVLLYATGGLALGHFRSDTTVAFGPGVGLPLFAGATHVGSSSRYRLGGAFGGGVEWMFGDWTAKIEYLYMVYQGFNYASPLVAPAGVAPGYSWNTSVNPREHIVRVGLNYKFNMFGLLLGTN
jgi:outer membrane immunogenic protein